MAFPRPYSSCFFIELCFVPLVIFLYSCSSLPPSHEDSFSSAGRSSYCSLLHVPWAPTLNPLPKPYLGIYLSSQKLEEPFAECKDNAFIQVAGIIEGSPADEAGLKKDDIIISVNGISTCRDPDNIFASFKKMIGRQEIGSVSTIELMRQGRALSLEVRLKETPLQNRQEALHQDIEACDAPSLLENSLRRQGGLTVYKDIIDGLYERSNTVHNPGSPHEKELNALQLGEVTYLMRHPLAAGNVARELARQLVSPMHTGDWHLEETIMRAAGLLDLDLPHAASPDEITFPGLLQAMEDTKNKVELVLNRLRPEEKALLQEKALRPWDDDKWNGVLDASLRLDRRELIAAFSPLLSFLTRNNLALLKEDLIKRFGHNKGPVLFEEMTPIGKVIVGGPGPNVYTEDAALILDLGGDDLYLNNAGGTRPGMPVALVIDWEGNDRYISKENFSQGSGLLGGGFLLDMSGNDIFVSNDGSQGAGFFGIGLLYHGTGNSIYNARSFSQGIGQMGIGLLLSTTGNNNYLCSHHGQGLGLFGGMGILIDEAGNDYYQLGGAEPDFRDPLKSTVSMGQGFGYGVRPEKGIHGAPGGIGILVDEEGDDTYVADYFAQGASYYYGLGILNDMAGDDHYISGRYCQGAGIHSSVGVLLDHGGNDSYYASFGVAQGMGHDYGIGYFEDDHGDDNYWGGILVQGAATEGSIGIFIDGEGKDRYHYDNNGQGFASGANSIAIMMAAELSDELKKPVGGEGPLRLGLKSSDPQ